MCETEENHKRR